MVELFSRDFGGQGPDVLILHGLFGSSSNWATMGKRFAPFSHAYGLDLRNHGQSPHAVPHSIEALAGDVLRWMDRRSLGEALIMGHSMGGHVAMSLALGHGERIRGLVVVDIAPRGYDTDHCAELDALSVEVSSMASRDEVDRAMVPYVADVATRRFLQMNLERLDSGFRWRLNVPALRGANLADVDFRGRYDGPALFLVGETSHYVGLDDRDLIAGLFPAAVISEISGADHWVHHSQPDAFHDAVSLFVAGAESRGREK